MSHQTTEQRLESLEKWQTEVKVLIHEIPKKKDIETLMRSALLKGLSAEEENGEKSEVATALEGLVANAIIKAMVNSGGKIKAGLVTVAVILTALSVIGVAGKWLLGLAGWNYVSSPK